MVSTEKYRYLLSFCVSEAFRSPEYPQYPAMRLGNAVILQFSLAKSGFEGTYGGMHYDNQE